MESLALRTGSTRALRPAHERDIPALAELWTDSFPGRKRLEERTLELHAGMGWGTLADCRVVEVEGRLVAALRAFRVELNFRGRTHATLGLSGVAVAQDHRRRGLGRQICVEAMEEARDTGAVLSILYPFRDSFYEDLGYTFAGSLEHYAFRPSDLSLHPGWDRVERLGEDETAEARALHARVAAHSNGMLTRPRSVWLGMMSEPVRLYAYRGSDEVVRAYALVSTQGRGRSTLRVRELIWENEESYLAMLGWLASQRDQFALVRYDALPSEAFYRRVPHPRAPGARRPRGLWFESARVLRGPMLRVLNVAALQDGSPIHRSQVDAMDPPSVARAFLDGRLPGQAPPPPGWSPISGAEDFRLLDEI